MKRPPRRSSRSAARHPGRPGRLSVWVGTLLLAGLLFELALPGIACGLHILDGQDDNAGATAAAPISQPAARADVARAAVKTAQPARTCCGQCCCADDLRRGGKCCCTTSAKPRPVPHPPQRPGDDDGRPAITFHCGHSPATVGVAPDLPKFCGRPVAATAPAASLRIAPPSCPRPFCADKAPETPPPKP